MNDSDSIIAFADTAAEPRLPPATFIAVMPGIIALTSTDSLVRYSLTLSNNPVVTLNIASIIQSPDMKSNSEDIPSDLNIPLSEPVTDAIIVSPSSVAKVLAAGFTAAEISFNMTFIKKPKVKLSRVSSGSKLSEPSGRYSRSS